MNELNSSASSEVIKRVVVLLCLVASSVGLACSNADRAAAELESAQAEWTRRLGSLRARQTSLEEQVRRRQTAEPAKGDDPLRAEVARRRLEATLVGGQQGLNDVEREVQRIGDEVKGAPVPADALLEARERMAGYLAAQEEALVSLQQQLATTAATGTPATATVTTGGTR